jgi:hypothetical protein
MDTPHPLGSVRETFVGLRTSASALGSTLAIGCLLLSAPLWAGHAANSRDAAFLRYGGPILGGLLLLWQSRAWWRRRRRLQVYEHGFEYREGSKQHVVRFERIIALSSDFTEVWADFAPFHWGHIEVQTEDGESLRIHAELERISELDRLLAAQAGPFIVKHALTQLQQGKEVDCGPLVLGPDAVKGRKTSLAYRDILTVNELSESSSFGNKFHTTDYLVLQGPDDQHIRVRAAAVRNRLLIAEIVEAMKTRA